MSELKACPFCGNIPETDGINVWCVNPECGIVGSIEYIDDISLVIGDWQSRPLEDALQRKLDIANNTLDYKEKMQSATEEELAETLAKLDIAVEALKKYANQDNWRPLLNQELGEHKVFIYSGCTPNILYAGMDAFEALQQIKGE